MRKGECSQAQAHIETGTLHANWHNLRLGDKLLREINPRLIYAAISGFGRLEGYTGGPYAHRPVLDIVADAKRMVALYSFTGESPERGRLKYLYPRGAFRCKDGYPAISIPDNIQWSKFRKAMEREDLEDDPCTVDGAARAVNAGFIRPILEDWLADKTRAQAAALLDDQGVPYRDVGRGGSVMTRHSRVVYRRMTHPHPLAERGKGVYLWDADGRRYIDGSGGAAVVNIGHGVAEAAQAMTGQAASIAYVHGTMFTTDALETHSERLAAHVPMPDPRFYYMASGAEAVETAIKFARQVQLARDEPAREVVISRWGSFHGATLGALAVTGKPKVRTLYAPLFRDQPHIPSPYCYRCPFEATHPICDLACAQALEMEILRQGPDRVVAFVAEPVGGATLGVVVPPEGYWPRIAEICDRYGVLLIADEVMVGFGRTGQWFAIEHFGVQPDVMTMGKGVTGGYFPLSVVAVRGTDVEAIRHAHGDFVHGGTFSHHAVGAAVALATLRYLEEHDLVAAAAARGAYLGQRLSEALGEIPYVGDVRGLGMLWGVEFVADRETKAPFPPEFHFGRRVGDLAFERGVIFYPGSGSVDGMRGDHVLIAPPFVIAEEEIDEMVSVLREAVLDVWKEIR